MIFSSRRSTTTFINMQLCAASSSCHCSSQLCTTLAAGHRAALAAMCRAAPAALHRGCAGSSAPRPAALRHTVPRQQLCTTQAAVHHPCRCAPPLAAMCHTSSYARRQQLCATPRRAGSCVCAGSCAPHGATPRHAASCAPRRTMPPPVRRTVHRAAPAAGRHAVPRRQLMCASGLCGAAKGQTERADDAGCDESVLDNHDEIGGCSDDGTADAGDQLLLELPRRIFF